MAPSDMYRTRFAPSPTGYLHKGHAYAALYAYDQAVNKHGELILRIEDIDQTRCRQKYEDAILEDLNWLGLRWPEPIRRQSDHMEDYQTALGTLIELGLVYRCFKTRKEIIADIARAPHLGADGPEGPVYIGNALPADQEQELLAKNQSFAWRLSMSHAREHLGQAWQHLAFVEEGYGPNGEHGNIPATPEIFGDLIIARKDVGTSYHMAVTHDDALQGITHVIRGKDLFFTAHLHSLLQALLDYPTPVYHHHKLITDEHGKKFSKRDQAVTIRSIRDTEISAQQFKAELF